MYPNQLIKARQMEFSYNTAKYLYIGKQRFIIPARGRNAAIRQMATLAKLLGLVALAPSVQELLNRADVLTDVSIDVDSAYTKVRSDSVSFRMPTKDVILIR